MIRVLMSLLVFASLFFIACGPTENADATDDTATMEDTTNMEEPATTSMGDDNYQTTVVDPSPASPRKEMKGTVGGVAVTVNYGSPAAKGRDIYGSLVPYGQVWRTGANESTTVEFAQPVMVNGQRLDAGKYGLFTIPDEGKWTIIFNSVNDKWGTEYDEAKDVLRVEATPQPLSPASESMEFTSDGSNLVLKWDDVMVPISVTAAS